MRAEALINLPESRLVRELVHHWPSLYHFFDFVIRNGVGPAPRPGWDYLLFANLPRTHLGLRRIGQPGDIDVLIVPHRGREIHAHLAAAIEVKRLALRGPNWGKNVDRYGVRQSRGLLRDGFPFVGILHLIVAEKGPPENHCNVISARVVDAASDRVEILGESESDLTSYYAAYRQYGRLNRTSADPVVGFNCVGIAEYGGGDGKDWAATTLTPGRPARVNPLINPALIRNIAAFSIHNAPHAPLRHYDAERHAGDQWRTRLRS